MTRPPPCRSPRHTPAGTSYCREHESVVLAAIVGVLGITAVVILFIRSRRQSPPQPQKKPKRHPTCRPCLATDQPLTTAYAAYLDPINLPNTDSILLEGKNIIIGRDEAEATLVLDDKSVARLHARIARQNDSYWLYDEGSAHGTYLNYIRLGLAPQAITDNDIISIGRLQFRFKLRPQPPEIEE